MANFWQDIEQYGEIINGWNTSTAISPVVMDACQGFCETLRKEEAARIVSDPRNISRVRSFRQSHCSQWSTLSSYLECEVAAEIAATNPTYEDFCTFADNHWLLKNYRFLLNAEMDMFTKQGISLKGKRICMVGPGALPYTGLAMAAQGAHVTLIDLYAPACTWCRTWLERFFPNGDWTVLEAAGQDVDYSGFDMVFVASMLCGRREILDAVHAGNPGHVIVRTTSGRRPFSLLHGQVPEEELNLLGSARFLAESNPPIHVGSLALLYSYQA